MIKARLLSDASTVSKTKAARIDEALLPARPRPKTSMMLARRLLSGALGVRVNLTKEEREKEAAAIRQAKGEWILQPILFSLLSHIPALEHDNFFCLEEVFSYYETLILDCIISPRVILHLFLS